MFCLCVCLFTYLDDIYFLQDENESKSRFKEEADEDRLVTLIRKLLNHCKNYRIIFKKTYMT